MLCPIILFFCIDSSLFKLNIITFGLILNNITDPRLFVEVNSNNIYFVLALTIEDKVF